MKTDRHWEKVGRVPHHGICLPLSALHSRQSCGIGEFLDLIPLIDWCRSLKLDCLQLLPLNDNGDDPSPYDALSSCALDPVYLSLAHLPEIGSLTRDLEAFRPLAQTPRVALAETKRRKFAWLRRYFQKTFSALSKTKEYKTFVEQEEWLPAYAQFRALKEAFEGKRWQDWAPSHPAPQQEAVDFYSFLQYHCFDQMRQVRDYASKRDVNLEGDVPILLNPDSADVWANRHLFRLDVSAGAPPDLYVPTGQNWGFPLFDWDAMRKDRFAWWRRRLRVAEQLYHLYRIDHVVGFFRIWAVPEGRKPTDGFFVPSDPSLWPGQGRELLTMMLDASSLLPIAEDLGTIPPETPLILKELGICGTKVLRWQRRWNDQNRPYIPYAEYEPYSLTTVSTPDMDPLKIWWKKYPDEAIPFAHFKNWTYQPDLSFDRQLEILRDAHHTPSYFHINLLGEYLSLFPELVSPNPEDERINVPGTLLLTNWIYRFRPSVEEIIAHRPLAKAFQDILSG